MLAIKTFFVNHGWTFWFFGGVAILLLLCFWKDLRRKKIKESLKISGITILVNIAILFMADLNLEMAETFSVIMWIIIMCCGLALWIINQDLITAIIAVYEICYVTLLINYGLTVIIIVGLYKILLR